MHFCRHTVGKVFLIALVVLSFPYTVFAEQIIRTYSSHIELQSDGSANVQEEIVYDFGDEKFHGIFRVVPLAVRALGKTEYTSLDISNIEVTDGKGNRLLTKYDKGGNNARLVIGDSNVTVSGPQLYVIRYTLRGAVTPSLVTDQFDWDVLGSDWNAGTLRTRAEIVFPKQVAVNKISSRCGFVFDNGNTLSCDEFAISATTTALGYTVRYEASNTPPHTHFLIQSTFPRGAITYSGKEGDEITSRAPQGEVVRWWERSFIDFSLLIPFVVFFILLSLYLGEEKPSKAILHSRWRNYLLAGVALFTISFFLPFFNLATLLSGLLIGGFGFLQRHKR